MTSKTRQETITIHILSNISKSQGNQTITLGQLIEYNLANIVVENSCTKCGAETSPRAFFKKSKLSISLDQQSEVFYNIFYCMSKSRTTKVF